MADSQSKIALSIQLRHLSTLVRNAKATPGLNPNEIKPIGELINSISRLINMFGDNEKVLSHLQKSITTFINQNIEKLGQLLEDNSSIDGELRQKIQRYIEMQRVENDALALSKLFSLSMILSALHTVNFDYVTKGIYQPIMTTPSTIIRGELIETAQDIQEKQRPRLLTINTLNFFSSLSLMSIFYVGGVALGFIVLPPVSLILGLTTAGLFAAGCLMFGLAWYLSTNAEDPLIGMRNNMGQNVICSYSHPNSEENDVKRAEYPTRGFTGFFSRHQITHPEFLKNERFNDEEELSSSILDGLCNIQSKTSLDEFLQKSAASTLSGNSPN